MKTITVFTPTYNRAYCLDKCYQSLKSQTNQDFLWLIIDDGSADNTTELVKSWIDEGILPIQYKRQENKGMVAAHNTAHHLIETELNVCLDSDDFMPEDAIDKILKLWKQYGGSKYAGLVGLDVFSDGRVIGTPFPDGLLECKFSEISGKYNVKGDKKYVLRSDLIKKYLPYPFFDGEKFPAPSYLYLFIEQEYNFLVFNEVLCVVEYLPDGNSMNKMKQYRKSPNAFAYYRIAKMKFALSYKERFRNAVHYVSSSLMAKDKKFLTKSPYKITTLLAFPLGLGLYYYISNTSRKGIMKQKK